jgi:hypothetical protein
VGHVPSFEAKARELHAAPEPRATAILDPGRKEMEIAWISWTRSNSPAVHEMRGMLTGDERCHEKTIASCVSCERVGNFLGCVCHALNGQLANESRGILRWIVSESNQTSHNYWRQVKNRKLRNGY